MYNKSLQTKDNIIRATIELIKTTDINIITLRDIAKASKIGIGLINYHFGSKEYLIATAIDTFINETISNGEANLEALTLAPVEKLKVAMTEYADFLANHAKISKVSIINALMSENTDTLSKQGIKYYIPILSEIFEGKGESDLVIILQQIVAPIQMSFIRCNDLKDLSGVDFFNPLERKSFVEKLVNNLVQRT